MKTWIVDLPQGSDEWKAHRMSCFNASDLACAMGIDPNGRKRSDLVRMYAMGIEQEFSDYVLKYVIEPGHVIEEAARLIIEGRTGDMLYPVTVAGEIDGLKLSASLDGITADDSTTMECKRKNMELWASALNYIIPDCYKPQMEQGLMLSGATKCIFVVSDGTNDGTIEVIYLSDPDLRAKIMPTWHQFAADVAAYQHMEVAPLVIAEAQMQLPAVNIRVDGAIKIIDNLDEFTVAAVAYTDQVKALIKKEGKDDQDFVNLNAASKKLKDVEEILDADENRALSQIESVEVMRRKKAFVSDIIRQTRLLSEKAEKTEKENRRAQIVAVGKETLAEHIAALNNRLGKPYMPVIKEDFYGVIKGKKTISSIKEAVNNELLRCKIEASLIADKLQANLKTLVEMASDCKSLFTDAALIIHKNNDDLVTLIKARIADNKAEIEAKEARRIAAQELADQAERVRIEVVESKAKKDDEEAAVKVEAPIVEDVKPAVDFPSIHRAGTGATVTATYTEVAVPSYTPLPNEALAEKAFKDFMNTKSQYREIDQLGEYEIARHFFIAGFLAGKAS